MIKFNLDTKAKKKPVHLIGEHVVWSIKMRREWLRKVQPAWAHRI